MQERLVRLYVERFGARPEAIVRLPADGSNRTYRRIVGPGGGTAIGAFGPDREENRAFLSFTRSFRSLGFPVPEVYAADEEAGVWLMEDLGDTTLFDALEAKRGEGGGAGGAGSLVAGATPGDRTAGEARETNAAGGFPEAILPAYRLVLEWLPRFQVEGHRAVDYGVAYPRAAFDRQSILWDLNYFKYHFLKLAHIPFNEARLEQDFGELASFLLEADTDYFLYRDFQSRNVLLRSGFPWFVDYQGGRRGALPYDVASLLYDAKADIPEPIREELLDHYLDVLEGVLAVAERGPLDRDAFRELYRGYVLVRIMQALGAYGYRGFFERKPRFLQSVPYAARNLAILLERGLPLRLPEAEAVFRRIAKEWADRGPAESVGGGLTVHVASFSYRRGYPEDEEGHGGGFVFDCRALPNPGRLEEFAGVTGRDAVVREWMERAPELARFWEGTRSLVEAQVEEYLRRGFTSLSVAFGCTGGQHRSPYMAERLAAHLRQRFPQLNVRVAHREEGAWPEAEESEASPLSSADIHA